MPTAADHDRTKYVSTGHLPPLDHVRRWLQGAYQTFRSNTEGENSQLYPDFARASRDLFDSCVLGTKGPSVMSVSSQCLNPTGTFPFGVLAEMAS